MGGTTSGGYGYGRATMMQLPGIRDENRKKLVSEDHLGGGGGEAVAEPKKKESKPVNDQPETSTTTLATAEVVVAPISSSTIEKVDEPKPLELPYLPPRPASPGDNVPLSVAPSLPPRAQAPALPSRSEIETPTISAPPTLPPRLESPAVKKEEKHDDLDEVADEAGWGIEEQKA